MKKRPLRYYRSLFNRYPNLSLEKLSQITGIPKSTLRYNKLRALQGKISNKEKWKKIFEQYSDKQHSYELAKILNCSRATVEFWAKKLNHPLSKKQKKHNWDIIFDNMPPYKFTFSHIARTYKINRDHVVKQASKKFSNWKEQYYRLALIYTYLTKNKTSKEALDDLEKDFQRYNLKIRTKAKKILFHYNWDIEKALENLNKFNQKEHKCK